jgi:hypothetical protein
MGTFVEDAPQRFSRPILNLPASMKPTPNRSSKIGIGVAADQCTLVSVKWKSVSKTSRICSLQLASDISCFVHAFDFTAGGCQHVHCEPNDCWQWAECRPWKWVAIRPRGVTTTCLRAPTIMATFLARGLGGVDVQQTFSIPRTQRKYSIACSAELLGSLSEFPDPRLDEGPTRAK